MTTHNELMQMLKLCKYKVSTDTRADLSNSVYFALKGDNFDGNKFVYKALKNGAIFAVTSDPKNKGKNILVVKNVLKTLQDVAKEYRELFSIPIIAIGGSNGKTTSKELTATVLKTKYKVHSTLGSLNNHIGVPLSILSMNPKTEIAVFEIGANHPNEHLELLDILHPTHVVVTNNGMDHLEGFGSPQGGRVANREIYDWALIHGEKVFVNKAHKDLMMDSKKNLQVTYPNKALKYLAQNPLTVICNRKNYKTQLFGNYNSENIELAVAIGNYFEIQTPVTLKSICGYKPTSRRSQFIKKNNINFVVDCYNANPTSMMLALQSFIKSAKGHKGVILGDMLELGKYSEQEHKKIAKYVINQKLDVVVFIGNNFKKALNTIKGKCNWFKDTDSGRVWFKKQNFKKYTFLLKGSRGIKVEKIFE